MEVKVVALVTKVDLAEHPLVHPWEGVWFGYVAIAEQSAQAHPLEWSYPGGEAYYWWPNSQVLPFPKALVWLSPNLYIESSTQLLDHQVCYWPPK